MSDLVGRGVSRKTVTQISGATQSDLAFMSFMGLYAINTSNSADVESGQEPLSQAVATAFDNYYGDILATADDMWISFDHQIPIRDMLQEQAASWTFVSHEYIGYGMDLLVLKNHLNETFVFLDSTDSSSISQEERYYDQDQFRQIALGYDPRLMRPENGSSTYLQNIQSAMDGIWASANGSRINLVGFSQGAYWATAYALQNPLKVSNVFNWGSPQMHERFLNDSLSNIANTYQGNQIPNFFSFELDSDVVTSSFIPNARHLDSVAIEGNYSINALVVQDSFGFRVDGEPFNRTDHVNQWYLDSLLAVAPVDGFEVWWKEPLPPLGGSYILRNLYKDSTFIDSKSYWFDDIPEGYFPLSYGQSDEFLSRLHPLGGRGWFTAQSAEPRSALNGLDFGAMSVISLGSEYYADLWQAAFGEAGFASLTPEYVTLTDGNSNYSGISAAGRGWISVQAPSPAASSIQVQKLTDGTEWLRVDDNNDGIFDRYVMRSSTDGVTLKRVVNANGLLGETPTGLAQIIKDGVILSDDVHIGGANFDINVGSVANILASSITRGLVDDPAVGAIGGVLMGALAENVGEGIALSFKAGYSLPSGFEEAFADVLPNIGSLARGAVSSWLIAELFDGLGIDGPVGDFAQTLGAQYVGQIISSLSDIANGNLSALSNGFSAAQIATAFGSFIGVKLASELVQFDSIAGQIGASAGSAIGVGIAVASIKEGALLGLQLGQFAGPVGAFVGAFAGFIVGGLIGSLFAGTPRSSADLSWNESTGTFDVGNSWAKSGASAATAESFAASVSGVLNGVLDATGSKVLDPSHIRTGRYGQYKKDFVYYTSATSQNPLIRTNDPGAITNFGAAIAMKDLLSRLVGGDVYVKRAINATLTQAGITDAAIAAGNLGAFDLNALLGNIAVAQDYSKYIQSPELVNGLMATESNSAFTVGWLVTLTRALELDLHKRATTDWVGGWNAFLDETDGGTLDGQAFVPTNLSPTFDDETDARVFAFFDGDMNALGALGDTIDTASKDRILGTAGTDSISVSGDTIANATGLTINGAAVSGAFRIDVAALIDGGDGNDFISGGDLGNDLFGGAGDDVLVGGKLDDWLFGGTGNDRLFAGAVANPWLNVLSITDQNAALSINGGNGDLLSGDDGDDILFGSTGSDWLKGGAGIDLLWGGSGGDILDGGAGNDAGAGGGAAIFGGGGTDQYVFGYGDGQDIIFDEYDTYASSGGLSQDSLLARFSGLANGTIARSWTGGGNYEIDGSVRGGEDAIVFGAGITAGDIRMHRSGDWDLVIELTVLVNPTTGERAATGDTLTIKDWFETGRRVEWLRFANGEEIRIGDVQTFITGTHFNDVLIGSQTSDFLYGGDGNDHMRGLDGDDWADGGSGNDFVAGDNDDDFVLGGSGNDHVIGGQGDDAAFGDAGADYVYGAEGRDVVAGGRGDDTVVGGSGDDVFRYNRGDGADIVMDAYVENWDQVWQDGAYINGYVLNSNGTVTKDGQIVFDGDRFIGVYDYDSTTKLMRRHMGAVGGVLGANMGADRLEFGVGINFEDLMLRQVGNDLQISISTGEGDAREFDQIADRLTLQDFYAGGGKHIEEFALADIGVLNLTNLGITGLAATDWGDYLEGSAGADWITGNGGDDTIVGGAGDDYLLGNQGADTINGGEGQDVLWGGAGDDLLDGGAAGDILIGGSGLDIASYVSSGAGVSVSLDGSLANSGDAFGDQFNSIEGLEGSTSHDTLVGDAGDNVLRGHWGDDALYGRAGDDSYEFDIADGRDTIIELAGEGEADALDLGVGLSLSSLASVNFVGANLVFDFLLWGSQVTIQGQTQSNILVETIQFADGLNVNLANLRVVGAGGTANDDLMFGDFNANNLNGGDGHDVISGGFGADTLTAGAGDDVLEGGADGDLLDGGADSLTNGVALSSLAPGAAWGDTIRYVASNGGVTIDLQSRAAFGGDASGDVITLGADGYSSIENVTGSNDWDSLSGDSRANRLVGLGGYDTLVGRGGDDVLIGGQGDDALYGGDGEDAIDAGDGWDSAWGGSGNDLISGGEGNDTFYGEAGDDILDGGENDDRLYGGDGADTLSGGAGNIDWLWGGAGNDSLVGGTGSDDLYGDEGDDTLAGEGGNDYLLGGIGDDTYVFTENDDVDTVIDTVGANRFVFSGIPLDRLWITRDGAILNIGVIGGTTRIALMDFYHNAQYEPKGQAREIATATGSLFLSHAQPLIDAMTAISGAPPSSMPPEIAGLLGHYWHAGGKAAPIVPATLQYFIQEDGSLSGAVNADDHDDNITGYAVAVQPQNGQLAFNNITGHWTYTPSANWNGVETFTLEVTDADNHVVRQVVTIAVAPMEDAPADIIPPSVIQISEDAWDGTAVGQFTAVDPDNPATTPTLSLVDNAQGRFRLSETGQLLVNGPWGAGVLDYEQAQIHNVIIRATDANGHLYDETFAVTVLDGNDVPLGLTFSDVVTVLNEDTSTAARIKVADINVIDDALGDETFLLSGANADLFEIDGTSLYLKAGAALDHEGTDTYQVTVHVDDPMVGSSPYDRSAHIILNIADANEAPIDMTLAEDIASVEERDRPDPAAVAPAPVLLGWLSGVDPDHAESNDFTRLVFEVSDARVEILNGNELWLRAGAMESLDFEAGGAFNVDVTVKDRFGESGALSYVKTFTFALTDAVDYLNGTIEADTLIGQAGRDVIHGFDGADTLTSGTGDDDLFGGTGNDALTGDDGADLLDAAEGDDTLDGGAGTDTLLGGAGSDMLDGGADADVMDGAAGDDIVVGGEGADQITGGDGFDTLTYATSSGGVSVNLATGVGAGGFAAGDTYADVFEKVIGSSFNDVIIASAAIALDARGGAGDDTLAGGDGDDNLHGEADADTITGGNGADNLYGGNGDDIITGGAGADFLSGGDGNDTLDAQSGDDRLDGGLGDDLLIGGDDNDTYLIQSNAGADTIRNYDPTGDDIDVIGYVDISREALWFEQSGDDLIVTAIGKNATTTIEDWYLVTTAAERANHKIDFFLAGEYYSDTVDVEGLVSLMAVHTKPATAAAYDALHANSMFQSPWAQHWNLQSPPQITNQAGEPIQVQTTDEDVTLPIAIRITDDITPANGITIEVTPSDPSLVGSLTVGAADANGNRIINFTPATNRSGSLTLTVRATDAGGMWSEQAVMVNVTPVADAPTIDPAMPLANTLDSGSLGLSIGAALADPDGSETLEITVAGVPAELSLNQGTDLGGGVWLLTPANLAGLALLGPASYATDLILQVTATSTEGANGATASTVFNVSVPINARPTDIGPNTASVNEYAANGTVVTTFTRTDPDGEADTATYQLVNDAGGRFHLVAVSPIAAELRVTDGSILNFEAGASHDIVVRVTDSGGLSREETVTVNLMDGNDAPTGLSLTNTTPTIAENTSTASRIKVADLVVTDDAQGSEEFALIGADASAFEILDGVLYLKAGVVLNYEAKNSYAVTVQVDDPTVGAAVDAQASFIMSLTDVNELPTGISFVNTTLSFAENTLMGSPILVGQINVADDALGTENFALVGADAASFTLVGANIYFNQGQTLNYEAKSSYNIAVQVDDQTLGSNPDLQQALTVSITNVNEAPYDIWEDRLLAFNENTPAGTGLAWFGAVDTENNIASFSIINDAGGRFALRSDGLLMVGPNGLNYEAGAAHTIGIRVTDAGGLYRDEYFTSYIYDVNEAPLINSGAVNILFTVPENYDDGGPVPIPGALFTISDAEATAGQTLQSNLASGITWSIVGGNPGNRFSISSTTGQIWYQQGSLEYEPQDVFNLVVRAQDQGGQEDTINVSIATQNVWEAPTAQLYTSVDFFTVSTTWYEAYLLQVSGWDPDGGSVSVAYNGGTPYQYSDPSQNILLVGHSEGSIYDPSNPWATYWNPTPTAVTVTDTQGQSRHYSINGSWYYGFYLGPVLLDLDGDGLEVVSAATSTVAFDADGDGTRNRTGWIGADDGLLVLDRNGDGAITNGSEISFLEDLPGAKSDLEGLRAFDTNTDGMFDAADTRFGEFRIWRDANQDGVSQAGELFTLTALGVSGVDLMITPTGATVEGASDNVITGTSRFTRADGSEGAVGDAAFAYQKPSFSLEEISAEEAAVLASQADEAASDPWTEWLQQGSLPLRDSIEAQQRFASSVTAIDDPATAEPWGVPIFDEGAEVGDPDARLRMLQLAEAMAAFESSGADSLSFQAAETWRRQNDPLLTASRELEMA